MESMAFSMPIFNKLTNAQQLYNLISYTQFYYMWKVQIQINLFQREKYSFHRNDFENTQNHSINFSGHLLHLILPKSDEKQKKNT
jgi:hypothetical protein